MSLFLSFAFGSLAGCASEGAYLLSFPGQSPEKVWEVLRVVVDSEYDIARTDTKEKWLETEWDEPSTASTRNGRRYRLRAELHREEGTGTPILWVKVSRQIQTSFGPTIARSEADWSYDGVDRMRAKRIASLVRLKLIPIRPSEKILQSTPPEKGDEPSPRGPEKREGKREPSDGDLWD
ncbi:MAG: hypothetical protein ACYTHM_02345 [Planctomycetota bacterium]